MIKLTPDAFMQCPHCLEKYDDPAKDFVLSKYIGPDSSAQDECEFCNRFFVAEFDGEKIVVRKGKL